jgi:hypothetical protein
MDSARPRFIGAQVPARQWLPEAVTPLFATWLLPSVGDGYLDGMRASVGIQVPFRYALVNGRFRASWVGEPGSAV